MIGSNPKAAVNDHDEIARQIELKRRERAMGERCCCDISGNGIVLTKLACRLHRHLAIAELEGAGLRVIGLDLAATRDRTAIGAMRATAFPPQGGGTARRKGRAGPS